ncbi:ROK family protein [Halomicrobium sp. LC1Hm]|uniref:ROK family protein n=1 Tax=Halomicrobium sp. LC1Hm TaxID=2610902 RepID=UPI0012982ECD|nr:ROK family protein [Halomicrobium sp. LC1Hm]QGA82438.1 Glucokinase [Halomicrobium sp. LC1Hm]
MDQVAVFGIGSTNFRYGVAVPSGDIITDVTVEPTRPYDLERQLVDAVADLTAAATEPLSGVAISCTGLVDRNRAQIDELDTTDGDTVNRIEAGRAIHEAHGLPVVVENDCNAAVLGEWHYGSRDDVDTLVHVTFGTGIGGGVVDGGRLVRGESAQAGEFGLLPVAPDSDVESTGVTGAWEAFCSGRGIARNVSRRIGTEEPETTLDAEVTAQDVFRAAAEGDAFAQSCLDRVARYNAAGIGAICNALNPGLITVGGGVAMNNERVVLDGIDRHLDDYLFVERPEIRISRLGDDIGLYGALAAFVEQRSEATVWEPTVSERADTDD